MRVSYLIELVTGLALLAAPNVVIRALIGPSEDAAATVVGRVLGGALVGLAIAGASAERRAPARGVMLAYLVYDVTTAAVLAAAGLAGTAVGALLWPVVVAHALLASAVLGSMMHSRRSMPRAGDSSGLGLPD